MSSSIQHLDRKAIEIRPRRRPPWTFAEWFILSLTFVPALLYLPGSQHLRIEIRTAGYGLSLGALVYFMSRRHLERMPISHPSVPWLAAAVAYLGLMLLHPNRNTLLAGVAEIGLYASVFAPVFWAPIFVKNTAHLKRLLWLLLICSGINSFVGIMQVRDPDRWLPQTFSSVIINSDFGLDTVTYVGADNRMIVRPPGLGDTPGAVAGPAVLASYLGLVFAVVDSKWWKKILALFFGMCGVAAIFLSLIRSSLIIAGGIMLVYLLCQIARRQYMQALWLIGIASVISIVAFIGTAAVGGESLTTRFQTIIAEDPFSFYEENRGNQVAAGFSELLPRFPLGAGLGRWGMMNYYFGTQSNPLSTPIWVEVQIPAWIVDGGIVLLVLYPIALIIALWNQAKLAFGHKDPQVRSLSTIIFASNSGIVAICLSYPVFLSPTGIQFWFLSGAIYGVAVKARRAQAKAKIPVPSPQDGRLASV
jgi:hypothetical protein